MNVWEFWNWHVTASLCGCRFQGHQVEMVCLVGRWQYPRFQQRLSFSAIHISAQKKQMKKNFDYCQSTGFHSSLKSRYSLAITLLTYTFLFPTKVPDILPNYIPVYLYRKGLFGLPELLANIFQLLWSCILNSDLIFIQCNRASHQTDIVQSDKGPRVQEAPKIGNTKIGIYCFVTSNFSNYKIFAAWLPTISTSGDELFSNTYAELGVKILFFQVRILSFSEELQFSKLQSVAPFSSQWSKYYGLLVYITLPQSEALQMAIKCWINLIFLPLGEENRLTFFTATLIFCNSASRLRIDHGMCSRMKLMPFNFYILKHTRKWGKKKCEKPCWPVISLIQ